MKMISIKRCLWCSFFIAQSLSAGNTISLGFLNKYTGQDLIDAVIEKNFLEIQTIVEAQPELVNFQDDTKWTPLHFAAERDLGIVKYLIEHNASVNTESPAMTPLHFAVGGRRLEIVKYLIAHNASVDAKNINGLTPLHFAADDGRLEIVKYLVTHNASVDEKNNDKETAYDLAVKRNHVQVTNYLKLVSDYQKAIEENKVVEFLNQLAQNNKFDELDDLFALALIGAEKDQAAFHDKSFSDYIRYKDPIRQLEIAEKYNLYAPAEKILSKPIKLSDLKLKKLLKKAQDNNNELFAKALIEYFDEQKVRMKKMRELKRRDFKDIKFKYN